MIENIFESYEIYDRESGELLARGPVVGRKTNNPRHTDLSYISLDGKWYMNTKEGSPFLVKKVECGEPVVQFNGPGKYTWKYWRDFETDLVDLYRDFCYDEIDPEVKPLCDELNKWDGIMTIGSCCGHGRSELWVQVDALNVHNLNAILNVLRSPKIFPKMIDRFRIPIDGTRAQCINCNSIIHSPSMVLSIVLMTTDKGEKAYESANLFARYLKEVRENMLERD